MALHEPSRHEALADVAWNEQLVRESIARIVADTHAAFDRERLWTIHPFDAEPERPASLKTLYYGAAGVIWAAGHLARTGAVPQGPDYRPAVRELIDRHRDDLRCNQAYGTYMASDSGLRGHDPDGGQQLHTGRVAQSGQSAAQPWLRAAS